MPNGKRNPVDRFWALAVIFGAVTGAVVRPAVVYFFWWSVADHPDDARSFGMLVSSGLGLVIGSAGAMVAGIATDDPILKVLWPALATVVAAAVSIATAYGTFCFLCIATYSSMDAGAGTPAAGEGAWTAYVAWIGVAGAAPVLAAGILAAMTRQHMPRSRGNST
jgi:hypothetical protein